MLTRYELQNIIRGNEPSWKGEIIQTIARHIRREKESIQANPESKQFRIEEEEILSKFIEGNGLWLPEPDEQYFIGEGAEQRVFGHSNPAFVIKTNHALFYACWEDYLINLLIHNYFFPHLGYELLGFSKSAEGLISIVKQAFVQAGSSTNLENVKDFLVTNGFIHQRANDYFHPEIKIILEDLHDENVLTKDGCLMFIDTVFYLMPDFWE
jgi:hypothetical protein